MAILRLVVGMAAVALTASCTSTVTVDGATVEGAGRSAGGGLLPAAWSTELTPVEPPAAVDGGFVFHAVSSQRRFEMVSVAAADGRVRWRAPASPSRVDHSVSLHLETVQEGRTVLWLEPGRVYSDGDVSPGRRGRRYRTAVVVLRVGPAAGELGPEGVPNRTAVCLTAYRAGSNRPRAVVLDAASGRVLSDRATPFVGNVRRMAEDLYAAGGELAGVNDRGELRWVRAAAAIFGGQPVNPDYGWRITGGDGRYFGSLGRVRAADAATVALRDLAATAAFDAATGRTLWTRPHASVFCGQLRFDADHPVLCSLTGTFNLQTRKVTGLDVTVTGIDPATGTDRWRAHFGAVEDLVDDGDDVIRTAATTYTLRTRSRLVHLDLDRGAQPTPAPDTGWCSAAAEVTPAENVLGVNRGDPGGYRVDRWYPCRIGGTALDRPAEAADFLHATVNGVLAYTTGSGTLRAVHTG